MVVSIKKRKSNAKADSNDIQTAIDDFGQKYHCDSCSKDITHLIIVRCAECQDFDLCMTCFSNGIEIKDHKKTHSYRVIDVLDFPIFEPDWGADEELLLVEGLEMFGLGNWEAIADHIGTKNKVEVEEHYNRVYVQSETWPYPDMTEKFDLSPGKRPRARMPGHIVTKLAKCPRAPASQPANHEIHGYMPGRKEFEHEFENDADQIVKDIEFDEQDTKEDIELKSAVLNSYNRILDLRKSRKEFIFDRNFVDFKRIQSQEKKRPREEKELYQKYRVFAKMQTAQDFEDFMDGLVNELKLRQRIQSLQEYLRMGISTLREANGYEKEKTQRLTNKNNGATIASLERSTLRRGPSMTDIYSTPGTPLRQSYGSASVTPTKRAGVDMSQVDGAELLSDAEKLLCTSIRVFPHAYISIKDMVLKEYAARGSIKKRQVRSLIKIDVAKCNRIFDFFVEMGWIANK